MHSALIRRVEERTVGQPSRTKQCPVPRTTVGLFGEGAVSPSRQRQTSVAEYHDGSTTTGGAVAIILFRQNQSLKRSADTPMSISRPFSDTRLVALLLSFFQHFTRSQNRTESKSQFSIFTDESRVFQPCPSVVRMIQPVLQYSLH